MRRRGRARPAGTASGGERCHEKPFWWWTTTRQAYAALLADCGFRVLEAAHGGEAILHVHRHRPDVVLMDMVMPVLGGVETAESLRGYGATARTPILAVTGCTSAVEQARMRGLCDELLLKPCPPEAIARRVERLAGVAA